MKTITADLTARRKQAQEFADDAVTVRIPRETLREVAAAWVAQMRQAVAQ